MMSCVVGPMLLGLLALIISVTFFETVGAYNPKSLFCLYKIYKQSDGTYQVWWVNGGYTKLEHSCDTYAEAKEFQIKVCKRMQDYTPPTYKNPEGKRVK